MRPQRNPSCAACPGGAQPRHAVLRAAFAGSRGVLGEPPARRKMPFLLPIRSIAHDTLRHGQDVFFDFRHCCAQERSENRDLADDGHAVHPTDEVNSSPRVRYCDVTRLEGCNTNAHPHPP
jgi:hypothetical protein